MKIPCELPVRVFHGWVAGVLAGALLGFLVLSGGHAPRAWADGEPPPAPPPSPGPPTLPTPVETSDDTDGDGIPNAWEIAHHLDPNNPADAGSDFDNDGLTALQEYQLFQQTGGAAGDPNGKWKVETITPPPDTEGATFFPVAINNRGSLLVQAWDLNPDRATAFLLDAEGTWHEIMPDGPPPDGFLLAYSLNDLDVVVGERDSADWSICDSFIWDPANGYRPFTYGGHPAVARKMNNRGDWVGSIENLDTGIWDPAYVVAGTNFQAPQDWWPDATFTDINDSGEAMGVFADPFSCESHTFLATGPWKFDTGFPGAFPIFNQANCLYSLPSAMNEWGQFIGESNGQTQTQGWRDVGYVFDGEYKNIAIGGRVPDSLYPACITSTGFIAGETADSGDTDGAFVWRDGVGLYLNQLVPGIGRCQTARINDTGQILTVTDDNQILLISLDDDQDGDGMSNDWELAYGLDPNDPADA